MDLNFDFDEQLAQLAKIPKPARLAAVVGILVLVCAVYYFVSYKDSRAEVSRLHANAQELQRKLNTVRVVATNLTEFQQEVADLERDLELALKQLPDRKQFEDLLQDITTAGKKVGVTIKSIQRAPEVPHDFYAEVPFRIELEGGYHDLAMFFERVSRLARIVNIGSLQMSVAAETSQRTILRVEGTATTFRFLSDQQVDVTAPAAPAPAKRGHHG